MVITQSVSFHHARLEPGCGLSGFILREWHFRSELLRRPQPGDTVVSVWAARPPTTKVGLQQELTGSRCSPLTEMTNGKEFYSWFSLENGETGLVLTARRTESSNRAAFIVRQKWVGTLRFTSSSSSGPSHCGGLCLDPPPHHTTKQWLLSSGHMTFWTQCDFKSACLFGKFPHLQQVLLRRSWRLIIAT